MDSILETGFLTATLHAKMMGQTYFIEPFPCIQYCTKCLPCSLSFNPLNNSMKLVPYYLHFVDEGTVAQRGEETRQKSLNK